MFNFEDALKLIGEQTVLCVGDLMLDDFVYGEVSRISPEAPAPVLAVTKSELVVGGAGNVARNIAALGHAIWAFIKHYVFKVGFRDGWAGFVIALGNFEGTFYRYAKRFEETQSWDPPITKPIRRDMP